jgi:hypothetical protein
LLEKIIMRPSDESEPLCCSHASGSTIFVVRVPTLNSAACIAPSGSSVVSAMNLPSALTSLAPL